MSTPGVKEHEADYTLVYSEESHERPSFIKIISEDNTSIGITGDTFSQRPGTKLGAEANFQVHMSTDSAIS